MNPETMRFEEIPEGSVLEDRALMEGWPSFRIGDTFPIHGVVFRVTRCRGRKLTLESVRMLRPGEKFFVWPQTDEEIAAWEAEVDKNPPSPRQLARLDAMFKRMVDRVIPKTDAHTE